MNKYIKLPKENLQSLHFFLSGINFPVVVGSYNSWERQQLSYLEENFKTIRYTTEEICQWCIQHNIRFQILYPLKKISIIKNPYKFFKFIELKKRLHN